LSVLVDAAAASEAGGNPDAAEGVWVAFATVPASAA
jgi:hypothetical protein